MCGRYLEIDDDDLYEILTEVGIDYAGLGNSALCVNEQLSIESIAVESDIQLPTVFNGREIVPANTELIVIQGSAVMGKWGFPKWKGSGVIFNARSETALEKAMFKKPLLTQRCVIPSKGFFEWGTVNGELSKASRSTKKKDKYLLRREAEQVLLMAGMASIFRDPLGRDYLAYVILTTNANESVAPIHDRMPVILDRDETQRWLGDNTFIETVLSREGPLLQAQRVS